MYYEGKLAPGRHRGAIFHSNGTVLIWSKYWVGCADVHHLCGCIIEEGSSEWQWGSCFTTHTRQQYTVIGFGVCIGDNLGPSLSIVSFEADQDFSEIKSSMTSYNSICCHRQCYLTFAAMLCSTIFFKINDFNYVAHDLDIYISMYDRFFIENITMYFAWIFSKSIPMRPLDFPCPAALPRVLITF